MNFLSHYYCLQEENPYFILGAVMPDMVKDFSKIYNKNIENKNIIWNKYNDLMLLGVENHIKADDIFHNHNIFEKMQEIAKLSMKKHLVNKVNRQYVIAHVLIEIMIDQFIINKNPKVLNLFYSKIDNIKIENANTFFKKLKIDEKNSHFIKNFTNFKELRFLEHLKKNSGVIYTLEKVFSKKLQYSFLENTKQWEIVINSIQNKIENDIPYIIKDVKTKLYE